MGANNNARDISSNPQSVFCFLLHNSKDFSEYKKSLPRSLGEIPEYVAIKFGVMERNKKKDSIMQESCVSFVQVVYFSREKSEKFPNDEMGENNKEKVLEEQILDSVGLNFGEEDIYCVRVHYNNESLEIYLGDTGSEPEPTDAKCQMKVSVKFSKLLTLDMGKGHVGFVQDSKNGGFGIDFLNWKMVDFINLD